MLDQTIDCMVDSPDGTRPVHAVRPDGAGRLPRYAAARLRPRFLRDTTFGAKAGELRLLPGAGGVAGAVLGLGDDSVAVRLRRPAAAAAGDSSWRLEPASYDPAAATLGFCLGAYRYNRFRSRRTRNPRRFLFPPGHEASLSQAAATWMVRDLINTPANLLGPVELADFAVSLADATAPCRSVRGRGAGGSLSDGRRGRPRLRRRRGW